MAKIQVIQRIPTESYAYIELNLEYDSAEEAFIDHNRLLKLHVGGTGLPPREWTKVRKDMLSKGECDPNLIEQMNNAQKWFINELKLGIRALTKE
jgi:hypothetical protein